MKNLKNLKNPLINILLFIAMTGLAYAGPKVGGYVVGGGGGRGGGAPIGRGGYSGNFVTGNIYGGGYGRNGGYGGYGGYNGYGACQRVYCPTSDYSGAYGFGNGGYCRTVLQPSPFTWGFGYISGGAGSAVGNSISTGPLQYIYWSADIASYILWRDGYEFPLSDQSNLVQSFLKSQRQKNK